MTINASTMTFKRSEVSFCDEIAEQFARGYGTFILHGDTFDDHYYSPAGRFLPLNDIIFNEFQGFNIVVEYDISIGLAFQKPDMESAVCAILSKNIPQTNDPYAKMNAARPPVNLKGLQGPRDVLPILTKLAMDQSMAVAIIINRANHIASSRSTCRDEIAALELIARTLFSRKNKSICIFLCDYAADINPNIAKNSKHILVDFPKQAEKEWLLRKYNINLLSEKDKKSLEEIVKGFKKLRELKAALDGVFENDKLNVKKLKLWFSNNPWADISLDDISGIETDLKKLIIGQDTAVKSFVNALKRATKQWAISKKKPLASIMHVGPTGTGKSELPKALANLIFDGDITRIDCTELQEKHSVARLTGAQPGYIGYDSGETLVSRIIKKGRPGIVLFDEIEKAHPDIYNLLMQILEDGTLTDTRGEMALFSGWLVVLTSNIGYSYGMASLSEEMRAEIVHQSLREHFRPEFINRLSDIVIFNYFTMDDMKAIAKKIMNELKAEALKDEGLNICFGEDIIDTLVEIGYNPEYGAREMGRTIDKLIKNPLCDIEPSAGTSVRLSVENGKIAFEKE